MDKETENAVAALGGTVEGAGNNGGAGDGAVDYKSEFEKLQKQLQGERVEAGRLKKANEENAALRKELEELKSQRRTDDAVAALPENIRQDMPDDFKQGAAMLAQHTVDKAMSARDQKLADVEARLNAEEQRRRLEAMQSFVSRIEQNYPGFLASIKKGGDKQKAWADYQRHNAATIKTALAESDYDTLSYHIKQFYGSIGVAAPSGNQDGAAAPDPRAMGGGVKSQFAAQPGRTYSIAEYKQTMEDAQAKFQQHLLTYREYSEICGELTKAYREGRVK